ncbi:hypothetical protein GGP78_003263 [Salinibacter ruber]|jgi:hypothetical protein|uniref:hypothetical protein n=1 Tax=Salinibacter ruber TaxID=146919 RepID=UPI00216A546F|nr:hypothetical protein [Salinibacter ruber]MCS3856559.1 hypothetical protein [Salinibacter ruber]
MNSPTGSHDSLRSFLDELKRRVAGREGPEGLTSEELKELTDEELKALAPDPEAKIPGTAVRWKEATDAEIDELLRGRSPSEVF